MRLFIAVQITDKMKTAIIGMMHDLKQQGLTGNYVPASNLHMTLAFIGEVKSSTAVQEVLREVPGETFRIAMDGMVTFGDAFCISIKGNQKLKNYTKELRRQLKARGVPCADDKFVPHVTLVRKTGGKRPEKLPLIKDECNVTKISLMKSEQKNGKSVYTEIFSVPVK